MEQPEPVHVEIDPVTVEGTVTEPGAAPCRFAGWLELVGLLERARAGTSRADSPDPAS